MMKKRLICLALVLCIALSCAALSGFSAAERADLQTAAEDYGLAPTCADGNMLHCFDWTLSQIKAELPNIAKAGFTSVQTSPLQPHGGNYQWYWLYQPTNFTVGNEIGSLNDLKALCTEADKYGIKIIVDVVANHVAGSNSGSWGNIDSSLRKTEYFHNQGALPDNSNDRYEITHKNIGMPDLNSEHPDIQNKVYSMLTTLKNAGVDGIRWDAAKHIGLPSEDCAFWSKMASLAGLYQYGEILEAPANKSSLAINAPLMKEYTQYINVTDDMYGATITQAIRDGKVVKSNGNWTKNDIPADKLVYWGESHDSYSNDGSAAWSKNINQNAVDRAYAILGARAGSQTLYFSRPNESAFSRIAYGQKGSTHYTSKEVAAVNHFHNAMAGTEERYGTGSGCYVICRGGGAVIVSAAGSNTDVTVVNKDNLVPDGTYTDEVSGAKWTVKNGSISGRIGSTGIAVFYDTEKIGGDQILIGDVDQDGEVAIVDATCIQRNLVSLYPFDKAAKAAADTDGDGEVTVVDATLIQRYLASLKDKNSRVGEYVSGG